MSNRKRNFKIEIVDVESGKSVDKVYTIKDAKEKLSELLGRPVSIYSARMASSRGDVIDGKYKLERLGKKRDSKASKAPVPPGKQKRKLKIRKGKKSKEVVRPLDFKGDTSRPLPSANVGVEFPIPPSTTPTTMPPEVPVTPVPAAAQPDRPANVIPTVPAPALMPAVPAPAPAPVPAVPTSPGSSALVPTQPSDPNPRGRTVPGTDTPDRARDQRLDEAERRRRMNRGAEIGRRRDIRNMIPPDAIVPIQDRTSDPNPSARFLPGTDTSDQAQDRRLEDAEIRRRRSRGAEIGRRRDIRNMIPPDAIVPIQDRPSDLNPRGRTVPGTDTPDRARERRAEEDKKRRSKSRDARLERRRTEDEIRRLFQLGEQYPVPEDEDDDLNGRTQAPVSDFTNPPSSTGLNTASFQAQRENMFQDPTGLVAPGRADGEPEERHYPGPSTAGIPFGEPPESPERVRRTTMTEDEFPFPEGVTVNVTSDADERIADLQDQLDPNVSFETVSRVLPGGTSRVINEEEVELEGPAEEEAVQDDLEDAREEARRAQEERVQARTDERAAEEPEEVAQAMELDEEAPAPRQTDPGLDQQRRDYADEFLARHGETLRNFAFGAYNAASQGPGSRVNPLQFFQQSYNNITDPEIGGQPVPAMDRPVFDILFFGPNSGYFAAQLVNSAAGRLDIRGHVYEVLGIPPLPQEVPLPEEPDRGETAREQLRRKRDERIQEKVDARRRFLLDKADKGEQMKEARRRDQEERTELRRGTRNRTERSRYNPVTGKDQHGLGQRGFGMFKKHHLHGSGTIYRDVPVVDDIQTGLDERRLNQVRFEQQQMLDKCQPKQQYRKTSNEEYFSPEELKARQDQDRQAQSTALAQDEFLEKLGDQVNADQAEDEVQATNDQQDAQNQVDGAADGAAAPGGGNGNANGGVAPGGADGNQQEQPPAAAPAPGGGTPNHPATGMDNTVIYVLDNQDLANEFFTNYLPDARLARLRYNLYYVMGRPGHWKTMLQQQTLNMPFYYHMEQAPTSTTLSNNDLTSRGFINCQMIHDKFYSIPEVQQAQEKRLKDYLLQALRKYGENYPSKSMLNALSDFGFTVLLFSEVESGRSGFDFDPKARTPEANAFMGELNALKSPPSGMRYSIQQRIEPDPDNPINAWVCLAGVVTLTNGEALPRALNMNLSQVYNQLANLCGYETTLDRALPETIADERAGSSWGAPLPSEYYSTRSRQPVEPKLLGIGKLREVLDEMKSSFPNLHSDMWKYDDIVDTYYGKILTSAGEMFDPDGGSNNKVRSMLSGFDLQDLAYIGVNGGCFPTIGMTETERSRFVENFVRGNRSYNQTNLGYTVESYCGICIGNDPGNVLKNGIDILQRAQEGNQNVHRLIPTMSHLPWWFERKINIPNQQQTFDFNVHVKQVLQSLGDSEGWPYGGEARGGVAQRGGEDKGYQIHGPSLKSTEQLVPRGVPGRNPIRGQNRMEAQPVSGRGLLDTAGLQYPENVPYVQTSTDLEDEYALLAYSRPRQLRYGMKEESSADIQRPFMYRNFRRPAYDSGKSKIPDAGTSLVNVYRPAKSVRSMNVNGLPVQGIARSNQEKLYEFQYDDPRGPRVVARDPNAVRAQVMQGSMRQHGNPLQQAYRQGASTGPARVPFEQDEMDEEPSFFPNPTGSTAEDNEGERKPFRGSGNVPHMRISRPIIRKNLRNRPTGHARKGSANNLLHGEIQDVQYYPQRISELQSRPGYDETIKIPELNLMRTRPSPLGSDPRTYTPRPVDVLK